MAARPYDEGARKVVHVAFVACAFALRYLSWWQSALLAGAAVAFNLWVLPQVARQLYRPREVGHRLRSGIVLYPLSVLALVLLFPARPDIAAAAWAILAVGDGMATIVGRRSGRRPIPWNPEKSVAGAVALFLCGGLAGAVLAWWCRPNVAPTPEIWFSIAAPFVGRPGRRVRRNHPDQTRRQRVGAGRSRRRALGALARSGGFGRAGGGGSWWLDAGRRCGKPAGRGARLSRGHCDSRRRGGRGDHRHRDRGYDGMARLGVVARDFPGRISQLPPRAAAQDAPRNRGRARRTPGRRKRDCQYRARNCRGPAVGPDLPARARAARLRCSSRRRRERHGCKRDRKGMGTSHLPRVNVPACGARHSRSDVSGGNCRRRGRCEPARMRSESSAASCLRARSWQSLRERLSDRLPKA